MTVTEMTRNMMSFNGFGPSFNPSTTDISSLPDDYNKTDSEIVEMGGQRFIKKTTTLKKGGPGASFFVRSTTYERVNDADNTDSGSEESIDKKKEQETPAVAGSEPSNATTDSDSAAKEPRPASSTEEPQPTPDVQPSSSPAPPQVEREGEPGDAAVEREERETGPTTASPVAADEAAATESQPKDA